jgi:hypothetical protein
VISDGFTRFDQKRGLNWIFWRMKNALDRQRRCGRDVVDGVEFHTDFTQNDRS